MNLRGVTLILVGLLIAAAGAVEVRDFGLPAGFVAEEVLRVPKQQGSWICLAVGECGWTPPDIRWRRFKPSDLLRKRSMILMRSGWI